MKISIVTPSFNQGRFIERTLRSVACQRGAEIEHVVFDGASTDETIDVLKGFSPPVRWVSEKDQGQTDAVNKGILATDGEVIGWLNSDDVYYPEAIASVVTFLRANPEVDVVYGMADHIDVDDQPFETYPTEPWNFERLKQTCFISQPAVFFRRRVVEQHGLLDASLHYCMDYEFWLRLGRLGVRFAYLQERLAGSRLYAETKTLGARVKAHREINDMLLRTFGVVPDNWLYNYAHVAVAPKIDRQAEPARFALEVGLRSIRAAIRWNSQVSKELSANVVHWIQSEAAAQHPPVYEATLAEGIDFRRPGYPSFLAEVTGMSHREEWGRWTDANMAPAAKFVFKHPLPQRFKLVLTGHAFGPNVRQPVRITCGGVETFFLANHNCDEPYTLLLDNPTGADTIELASPEPCQPEHGDPRRLGFGLITLRIEAAGTAKKLVKTNSMRSIYAPSREVIDVTDCYFYHTMDLPKVGTVQGNWDLRPNIGNYLGNVDFRGKRVLDVGCANGALSFYMEKQGAEVVSYDLDRNGDWDMVPFAKWEHYEHISAERKTIIDRLNNAYWFSHKLLNSRANVVYGEVYKIPNTFGPVDISVYGSILLHLRDPFLALQNGLRLTRDTVIVAETLRGQPISTSEPYLGLLPDAKTVEPKDTWWDLRPEWVVRAVGILGFEDVCINYHTQRYEGREIELYTVVARRTHGQAN